MAFCASRACSAIGGFDPQFRIAGDDVDICWRLQDAGLDRRLQPRRGRLAPPPRLGQRLPEAAVRVRQGRGAAGAQVARALQPRRPPRLGRPRLRRTALHEAARGVAGRSTTAPGARGLFQSVYQPRAGILASLPLMPEWYLVIAALAGLSALGAALVAAAARAAAAAWPRSARSSSRPALGGSTSIASCAAALAHRRAANARR